MWNTINKAPTNEHDVAIEMIRLEKLKEISKQLPVYSKLCSKYLIPAEGMITITICGEKVSFNRERY